MNKYIKKIMMSGLIFSSLITLTGQISYASHLNNINTVHKIVRSKGKNRIKVSRHINKNAKFNKIVKIAKSKLGDKYCWGATGPNRFDCSGFTQYIFKHGLHKHLPRIAGAQYTNFKHIQSKQRKAGDLVFFGLSKHNISHVGLYLGHDKMIDAQNRGVVIEHVHAPWWHSVGYSRPINFND